jgi:hypothetical protein
MESFTPMEPQDIKAMMQAEVNYDCGKTEWQEFR